MKILINTPSLSLLGGVANHYLGLKDYWTENVKYNTVGKRSNKSGSGLLWLPYDVFKFIFKLLTFHPDVILLNPSLGNSALKRDFIFLNIAHFFGFKVAIMIHGFDWDYAKVVDKAWVSRNLNKSILVFVLAQIFKNELLKWGVKSPVILTTTKVDDMLLENYSPLESRSGEVSNILFLARIERTKGVFIAVDSFWNLKKKYKNLTLTIAGNGNDLVEVEQYVKKKKIPDVCFCGRLDGKAVADAYKNADLFLFPTYYGEGLPTVVLEAMAFGLPVFTRTVGGLVDFFENGKMGFITDSLDPADFANAMEEHILNPELTKKVSDYNATYAASHFMASEIAKDLEHNITAVRRNFTIK